MEKRKRNNKQIINKKMYEKFKLFIEIEKKNIAGVRTRGK